MGTIGSAIASSAVILGFLTGFLYFKYIKKMDIKFMDLL